MYAMLHLLTKLHLTHWQSFHCWTVYSLLLNSCINLAFEAGGAPPGTQIASVPCYIVSALSICQEGREAGILDLLNVP